MSRYIDADALKQEFTCESEEWIRNIIDNEPTIDIDDYIPRAYYEKVIEELYKKHADEIAGMPTIVRCKECKYATKRLNDDYLCTHHGKDWNYYDHFCSYGERSE